MKLYITSMRDLKSCYVNPNMEISKEVAIRNFKFACRNKNSIVNFAPEDFRLECLGTWDNETGVFDIFPAPEILADGVNMMRGEENG